MKTFTCSIPFENNNGRDVEINVTRDAYGDLSLNWIRIYENRYTAKQVRTVCRENIILEYAAQFVDIEEFISESIYDLQTI